MTEEKAQVGTMEAFSFRKGVVKIIPRTSFSVSPTAEQLKSGKWIRFSPEVEGSVRRLSVGDTVNYTVENGTLKAIEKAQTKQPAAPPVAVAAPAKAQATLPAADTRNRSIERQVALKAAVELAGLYGYKSTKECLDVAASFAAWIEAGNPGDVQFNGSATAGRTANPSPSN